MQANLHVPVSLQHELIMEMMVHINWRPMPRETGVSAPSDAEPLAYVLIQIMFRGLGSTFKTL